MKVWNTLDNRKGRYATIIAERGGQVLYHAGEQGDTKEHFAQYCIQPAAKFWNEYKA